MDILQGRKQVNSVKGRKKILYLAFILIICMTGCSPIKEQSNLYKQYINKIWIGSDIQLDENVEKEFSFIIKKIENGYVEGQYGFTPLVLIPKKESYRHFTGYIEDSEIKCQLWNKNKEVGSMVLEYVTDDCLKADIEYNDEIADDELYSESIYEVYNVENLKETDIFLDQIRIVNAELDKWGKVQLLPGLKLCRHTYPVAFMTNEQGDILYEFRAGYKTGSSIKEIEIYDFNGDGLKDVDIITFFVDDTIEPLHWVFCQDEGGTFHKEEVWQGD